MQALVFNDQEVDEIDEWEVLAGDCFKEPLKLPR